MQPLKIFTALTLTVFSLSVIAAERPSLSKHEKRIGDLEVKSVELEETVNSNKQLIDENKQAINNIAVVEGPQGPSGPQGPKGEDGALAGLNCQTGQVAQFDGADWQCASGNQFSPSDRHQTCIQGYDFNVTATGGSLSEQSVNGRWREACGLLTAEVKLRGPAIAGPAGRNFGVNTAMLSQNISAPEIELNGRAYTDSLIGIYPHRTGGDHNTEFVFTLVFQDQEIYQDLAVWTNHASNEPEAFEIRQPDLGLVMDFSACRPDTFSAIPVLTMDRRGDTSIQVKQTLTIDCGGSVDVQQADPFWQGLQRLFSDTNQSGDRFTEQLSVIFDASINPDISVFDQVFNNARFTALQLPAFYQDPARLFSQEQSPWIAGPHEIVFEALPTPTDGPL